MTKKFEKNIKIKYSIIKIVLSNLKEKKKEEMEKKKNRERIKFLTF